MKKSDLQVNDIVRLKNGQEYMLHEFEGELCLVGVYGVCASLDDYDDDLHCNAFISFGIDRHNIVEVKRPTGKLQLSYAYWDRASSIWSSEDASEAWEQEISPKTIAQLKEALCTIKECCEFVGGYCEDCMLSLNGYDCQFSRGDKPAYWDVKPKISIKEHI